MLQRLQESMTGLMRGLAAAFGWIADAARRGAARLVAVLDGARGLLLAIGLAGLAAYALQACPPLVAIAPGEAGVRVNRLTGAVSQWRDGSVLRIPGLHEVRVYSLRDRTYRPRHMRRADGPAPLQSVEGLSLGVDLAVRYALDPGRLRDFGGPPQEIGPAIVEPAVHGVIYRVFARYTVREIFSAKRAEIQQAIEGELRGRLAADGLLLRAVLFGPVDLPADYRRGMEKVLAEELAAQKMRYTLELKDKRVRQTELEGEAEKVRRQKTAEATARAQVIAAKAQEEAMQHVLPFKRRQIEQRRLEAEAERALRIRRAQAAAEARRIEAEAEAEARRRLADAESYRMERVGKAGAEQMAREGALLSRHPLLIQKAMADKLSDKIQVIIAPAPEGGAFIASSLLGKASGGTGAAK